MPITHVHWTNALASPAWAESMPLPLSQPIREAIGKKHLAIWTGVRLQNGSFLCDSLPRTDEREAYNQFSLPPNPKATAGKARALRPRGGSRSPPRKLQRRPSKTNQSPSESLSLAGHLHANGNQACQPVRLGLQLLALHYSLSAPNTAHRALLTQCPCSPSLHSLRSAGKPTPNLGDSDSRIW